MKDEEIIDIINKALAAEFEIDLKAMKSEAHLIEDLEFDSLDIIDLVVTLENAFSFKIREEDEIKEIRTLGDIYRFVISKNRDIVN